MNSDLAQVLNSVSNKYGNNGTAPTCGYVTRVTSVGAVKSLESVQAKLAAQGRQVFSQGIDRSDKGLAVVFLDLVIGLKAAVGGFVLGQDAVHRGEVLVDLGSKGLVALFYLRTEQIEDLFAPSTLPWKSYRSVWL